ncbi:MAG: transcriptional repressor [Desulfomonile tiedjei]|nr:transcriptional repressor [Desulfomonile tiedjei]
MTSEPEAQSQVRTTRQRRIMLAELEKLRTHPTAHELYEVVRKRLPKISLGTVYRNLEILSECGMVQKLGTAGTQKRFDAVTANHYHVRCTKCGRVADVPVALISEIDKIAAEASDFEIFWHHLEFGGLCPGCKGGSRRRQLRKK